MSTGIWWTSILLHAAFGVGAFVIALVALSRDQVRKRRWLPQVLLYLVIGLVVFMAMAIVADWNDLAATSRIAMCGLFGLGIFLVWRGRRAVRCSSQWVEEGSGGYPDDLGFILISLFEGFVIVAAIDLGAAWWLVAFLALTGPVAGHRLLASVKRNASPTLATSDSPSAP